MNHQSGEKTASGSFEARGKFQGGRTEECSVNWKMTYSQDTDGRYWMHGHKLEYEIQSHEKAEHRRCFYAPMFHEDIAKTIRGGSESEKAVRQAISLNEHKGIFRFVNRSRR